MIIVDSREKWTQSDKANLQNIRTYFDRHGVDYSVRKLDYGDYVLADAPDLVIDRKKDIGEVCTNLASPDSSRFWREMREAHKRGIKMVILVEHGGKIRSLCDVAAWRSRYSSVSGRALMDKMYKVHIAYGVEWVFCDKRSTGKRIVEILTTDREKWLSPF